MTNHRLPYTDAESLPEMAVDAHEVEHNMHLPRHRAESYPSEFLGEPATSATARVHSHYEVSDDLRHRVEGMELHFD
jgi:hypothetical protein